MKCRWSLLTGQPLLAAEIAAALKISPLFAQCLLNRGLSDVSLIAKFLEPRLRQLADPFLLPDMAAGVERLFRARARGEPLVIFGDYDVDGVTSTALLREALGRLGWKVECYLPHRLDEGYGLSEEAIEKCLRKHPTQVLLAVDCGSTSAVPIQELQAKGIDTIVLDHHQLGCPVPCAVALVNPHRDSSQHAFRELCSVGLAFKLVHALVKRGRLEGLPGAAEFDLRPLLDLVALGTIADLVPLTGENRILVSAGLERLSGTGRPGLQALMRVAGTGDHVGVYEVAFQLAPRLNAAGRLENAWQALELLLATDSVEAERLARALDAQNRERQQIERQIAEQVIASVRAKFKPSTDYVIVEGERLWHLGVVGIVASRVLREFYRPTVIVGGDGEGWRGSGRSVDGFDLAAALRSCADLLTRCGGHAMAAGLSLPGANLDAFRERLNSLARSALSPELMVPALRIDAQTSAADLTLEFVSELSRLEPLGQGNPPVHLLLRGLTHQREPRRIGKNGQHLKMWVGAGGITHESVWWNCVDSQVPDGPFDLVVAPQMNHFLGRQSVQLKALDGRSDGDVGGSHDQPSGASGLRTLPEPDSPSKSPPIYSA